MAEMEFREKLVVLRRENHMTQSVLANELNVTRQTVYKWETGQSYPEAMTLFAMRNLFGVPTDILLDKSVTLAEYRRDLAGCGTRGLNPAPTAEVSPEKAEPGIKEAAAPAEEQKKQKTAEIAPAAPEEDQKEEKTAETAPQKKKKGLFSRLFNR